MYNVIGLTIFRVLHEKQSTATLTATTFCFHHGRAVLKGSTYTRCGRGGDSIHAGEQPT